MGKKLSNLNRGASVGVFYAVTMAVIVLLLIIFEVK